MKTEHLYGIHDWAVEWGEWVRRAGMTAWCVTTHQYGDSFPSYLGDLSRYGVTPIARLNWSHHGKGTIPPAPADDALFADWCARFAAYAGPACDRYIVGNEPNIAAEWGSDNPVKPERYVQCYLKVYKAVKTVRPTALLMPAAVGPWNVESGTDWVSYQAELLRLLDGAYDALALHTYSRGYAPESVVSEERMDPPYQEYRKGFRTYRDMLRVVPFSWRHKPVFITETNGDGPWPDGYTTWVQEAYKEIARWNDMVGTQKIHALVLFRWPKFDRAWQFETKSGVHEDFKTALRLGYRIPGSDSESPRRMTVTAMLLNVRSGPGLQYKVLRILRRGDVVLVTGETDGWAHLGDGYASIQWLSSSAEGRGWQRVYAFIRRMEGGWSEHPDDPGGPTMYGITLQTYTAWRLQRGLPAPTVADLRNITEAETEAVYKTYWTQSGADRMEWPLTLLHMDTAVNAGIGVAAQMHERSAGDFLLYFAYLLDWYADGRNFPVFGRGWIKRRAALLLEAAPDLVLSVRD